jgi:hypothetical protein
MNKKPSATFGATAGRIIAGVLIVTGVFAGVWHANQGQMLQQRAAGNSGQARSGSSDFADLRISGAQKVIVRASGVEDANRDSGSPGRDGFVESTVSSHGMEVGELPVEPPSIGDAHNLTDLALSSGSLPATVASIAPDVSYTYAHVTADGHIDIVINGSADTTGYADDPPPYKVVDTGSYENYDYGYDNNGPRCPSQLDIYTDTDLSRIRLYQMGCPPLL